MALEEKEFLIASFRTNPHLLVERTDGQIIKLKETLVRTLNFMKNKCTRDEVEQKERALRALAKQNIHYHFGTQLAKISLFSIPYIARSINLKENEKQNKLYITWKQPLQSSSSPHGA
jgi:hypothetical protein